MAKKFAEILGQLPHFRETAEAIREVLLANLVLIGEIPSPTFREGTRCRYLQNRFSECGLINCSEDEVGNAFGILPGDDGEQSILIVAHLDTVFSEKDDHTIAINPDRAVGPAVGDNSLGLAVLATLPTLLEKLDIHMQSNVVLMGSSRSLGRGDLEGLRFFLGSNTLPIRAAVCIEGVQLGRLSIGSIGMLRGEIVCTVPEAYDWTRFGASSAIVTLNDVIDKIMAIALPKKPRTSIILGSIEGGASFNTIATHATLRFEIRSECDETVNRIREQIDDIVSEVTTESGSEVTFEIVARRRPGGIPFAHPLSRRTRKIMETLGVEHRMAPSTSELSALIRRGIPAVTVGITAGEHLHELDEMVMIEPMFTGLAQLVGILAAIDGNFCDEHK
jgi:acetylornithine deacetylase/succinyl-diaminopimelate desuccinylase-like protein